MGILIGADIMPEGYYSECMAASKVEQIIGNRLGQIMKQTDYSIFNLELPLTNKNTPIKKVGKNKSASPSCAKGLHEMGINIVNLSNNHCMDQDAQGLIETIRVLHEENIAYVGAGENLHQAMIPYYFYVNEIKIGIYACAEHEFSIAKENYPGANPYNPLESYEHVEKMRHECDFIIILYHGGKEYYPYPSPQQQKVCRKFIDKGANIVICQHNHCIACGEQYANGTIIYGQGDFISAYGKVHKSDNILVSINNDLHITYIPVTNDGELIDVASNEKKEEILTSFFNRSEEIKEPGFIEEKYRIFAREKLDSFISTIVGQRDRCSFKFLNRLTNNKISKKYALKYRKKYGLSLRNYLECEAHRELIIQGLSEEK